MLPLAGDAEAGLLESADGILMVDAGDARHALGGDVNFANNGTFKQGIASGQVRLDRVLDVLEGLFLRGAL